MKRREKHMILSMLSIVLVVSGFVFLFFRMSAGSSMYPQRPVLIYVEPNWIHIRENETGNPVECNVSIYGATNIYGYDFKLYYNSSLLNGTAIAEGGFLKANGDTIFTIYNFNDNYNGTHGLVSVYSTLKGQKPGVNGTGTLITVTFTTKPSTGLSLLELADTKLSDPSSNPVSHSAINGLLRVGNPPQIRVPADYSSIQEAINAAEIGSTILVSNGTYFENVVVNKTVSLIGENKSTTIIDARHSGAAVLMTASSVQLDDFTVHNASSYAVLVNQSSFNDISTNVISDSGCGICLNNSIRNSLTGNLILQNEQDGLQILGQAAITNNTIKSNGRFGISVNSSCVSMTGNNIEANKDGVLLHYSGGSVLKENRLANNTRNLSIQGEVLSDFIQDIDDSNTINTMRIRYLVNKNGLSINATFSSDTSYLGIINCTAIRVADLGITNNGEGMLLAFSKDSTIQNVSLSANSFGIKCVGSQNVSIRQAALLNNSVGIQLSSLSKDVAISNCSITTNPLGLGENGIEIEDHSNSIFRANTIIGYGYAFYFNQADSNSIYHNNIVNNSQPLYVANSSETIWDNGHQGNYWSSYSGSDADGNGIGDTPYVLAPNQTDHFPLTHLYIPDIAVTNVAVNSTKAYIGQTVQVTVSVMNKWYENETFNVVVYANSTSIKTLTFAELTPFTNVTQAFAWNTSSLPSGNYTMTAHADILLGETEINDNTYPDGQIEIIKLNVDFNGDGMVNALDLRIAAIHFGESGSSPYDLNFDNIVNLDDLRIVASNYGSAN
jgi:parallel beta-helix repeat protein